MKSNYRLSQNMQIIQNGDDYFVYHSIFNNPSLLNYPGYQFLKKFSVENEIYENKKNWTSSEKGLYKNFINNRYLHKDPVDEYNFISNRYDKWLNIKGKTGTWETLSLKLTDVCNLHCSYCISEKLLEYSGEEHQPRKRSVMSFEIAKKAIDTYMRVIMKKGHKVGYITFGGGEALSNFNTMKRILEYCKEKYNGALSFGLNTNLVLMNSEMLETLSEYEITLSTSLDGPKRANDLIRTSKDGNGTFDTILQNIKALNAKSDRKLNRIWTVLTSENWDSIDTSYLDFLHKKGFTYVTIQPDITYFQGITPEEMTSKLIKLYKYGKKIGLIIDGFWSKPYKNIFENNNLNKQYMCRVVNGSDLAIMPNGDITICTYSNRKIGHIENIDNLFPKYAKGFAPEVKNLISSRHIGKIEHCQGCSLEGSCIGGCYLTNEYSEDSGNYSSLDFKCKLNRTITKALILNYLTDLKMA